MKKMGFTKTLYILVKIACPIPGILTSKILITLSSNFEALNYIQAILV